MIAISKELKDIIEEERNIYVSRYWYQKVTHQKQYMIWLYLSSFRKSQYWSQALSSKAINGFKKLIARIFHYYYLRKKNIYGEKTGIEIANHCELGRRLNICHGNVIINGIVGDDCTLHGNNVIGNKGIGRENERPILGDGIDVGVGAVVIGNIKIANGCIIAANAVVTKSFNNQGATISGVPGRVFESSRGR